METIKLFRSSVDASISKPNAESIYFYSGYIWPGLEVAKCELETMSNRWPMMAVRYSTVEGEAQTRRFEYSPLAGPASRDQPKVQDDHLAEDFETKHRSHGGLRIIVNPLPGLDC